MMGRLIGVLLVVTSSTVLAQSWATACSSVDVCFSLGIPADTREPRIDGIYLRISSPTIYSQVTIGPTNSTSCTELAVSFSQEKAQSVQMQGHMAQDCDSSEVKLDNFPEILASSRDPGGRILVNIFCQECRLWVKDSDLDNEWTSTYREEVSSIVAGDEGMLVPGEHRETIRWDTGTWTSEHDWPLNDFPTHEHWNARRNSSSAPGTISQADIPQKIPFGGDISKGLAMLKAHGILGGLAFVIFFPTGGIMIRLPSFPGFIRAHVAFQLFAFAIFICAFGLGLVIAKELDRGATTHPVIGIVVLIALIAQPILGWLHHRRFVALQRRNKWSLAHIWLGRSAILLGILNGGLGMHSAGNVSAGPLAAYGVVAGVMGVVYIYFVTKVEVRRKKAPDVAGTEIRELDAGTDLQN